MSTDRMAATASSAPQTTTVTHTIKVEAARILVEESRRVYDEENQRKESVDRKTGIFLAAIGAALVFLLTAAIKPPTFTTTFQTIVYLVVVVASLPLLLAAEVSYLLASRAEDFERIDLADCVNYEHLSMEESDLLVRFAATYKKLVSTNSTVTDKKLAHQERGQWLFIVGMGVLALGVIILACAPVIGNLLPSGGPIPIAK